MDERDPPKPLHVIDATPSAGRAIARRASTLGASLATHTLHRLSDASTSLLPHLDAAVDWMTRPEHIQQVQSILARAAQLGINAGFKVDHHAALIFSFVDWMEQEHGHEDVAARIWQYNSLADGTLIALLEARLGMIGQQDRQNGYERQLEDVRLDFMEMICSLASLEDETPMPAARRPEVLRDYFERCVLPERFYVLAGLGMGDPDAFSEMEQRAAQAQQEKQAPTGLTARLARMARRASAPPSPQPEAPSRQDRLRQRALTKLGPFDRDPSFRFLVNSYLFFLQTYTTRFMIERFPQAIALAKELDARHAAQKAAPEPPEHDEAVLDVTPE